MTANKSLEPIADPPHRPNMRRRTRVGLDQLAKLEDVRVERSADHTFPIPPHIAHQLGATHHRTTTTQQRQQQIESDARHDHIFAAPTNGPRRNVHLDFTDRNLLSEPVPRLTLVGRPNPAELHLDTSQQFLEIERLRHVVVGATA